MKSLFATAALTAALVLQLAPNAAHATFTPGDPDQYTLSFTDKVIERVRVENSTGHVNIRPTDGTEHLTVTYDKKKYPENCHIKVEHASPTELTASVTGEGCEVDLDLQVPKVTDMDIKNGSGSIDVQGLNGRLKFESTSGDVKATGDFKDVQGRSKSGDIDLVGVKGGRVESQSGDVKLKFPPDIVGQMEVHTGSGKAEILYPKGFTVKADSASGDVEMKEY